MQLCLATRNAHKIREIQDKLGLGFQVLSLDDILCNEELPETADTIEANSLQKAAYVWENYKVSCFADDSGLEVDALKGAPGVHSAYYSGSRDFKQNIDFLLKNLEGKPLRTARFKTVITLILEGKIHQFEGLAEGEILEAPRGIEGFGYDPVFLPKGYTQTFGEMNLEEKNRISARGRATQKLVDFLASL